MTHILTLETLIAKGACPSSQERFAELFPNGADLTVETFVDVAREFNWNCAAKLLLKAGTYKAKWNALHTKHRPEWAYLDYKHILEKEALRKALSAGLQAKRSVLRAKHAPERSALRAKYAPEWATLFATLYIHQESQKS